MYPTATRVLPRPGRLAQSLSWLCAALSALMICGQTHAQTAPVSTATENNAAATNKPVRPVEEPIALDPFVVNSGAIGYHGLNTMSGTRLNTKLEDLGSSTTVITKEQMEDFALLTV